MSPKSLVGGLSRPLARCLSVLFLVGAVCVSALAEKTGSVKGTIYSVDSQKIQVLWPNARVALKSIVTGTQRTTVSDERGSYGFTGVLTGEYEITVSVAGMETETKHVTIRAEATESADFVLAIARSKQSVDVTGEPAGVDLSSSTGGGQVLTAETLKSVVELNQDFQDALPLLPGVTRGLDGGIRIKGGRTNQTNTLVNTASVADPFTGQPALKLPAIAVQSVQVLSNPFSAEYGKFASGVVDVNTRGGGDQWKFLFEDPIPRLRWIDGQTHGVESATPHFTFAGPVMKDRLYLFQSLLYGYDTVKVWSLPDPDNVRVQESATTYSQLDWNATTNQHVTAVLIADPQETQYANIDTFNPQPVTADYRQRGFFASITHRWILERGGFVQSLFSAKRLDARVYPAEDAAGVMTLAPEQNSGTYFERQDRRTRLYQWSQTFHAWPMRWAGRHLISAGYSYARSDYKGEISNLPVQVRRGDGTLASTIAFSAAVPSAEAKNELAFFVQDNWEVAPRFTLDLGVRLDHDSLAAEVVDAAPRVGFVFAPTRDGRTAIRGGVGLFFDKIPINVAMFREYPAQIITSYANDGVPVIGGPEQYRHEIATRDQQLRVPYSLGWTLQFDRELRRNLMMRLGYEARNGYREFYVDPSKVDGAAELGLYNSGRQTYREYLAMLRWKFGERGVVYSSYVYSQAHGELNDYNQFFGNFAYPLIRANQYGPLDSDAPHRGLVWGVIPLPKKLDFIPILDVHTGFPYSAVDRNWNYIGRRNEAGRRPVFVGFDTKFQYPVDFTVKKHRIQFRAGLTVLNVINHDNPRDVQQYVDSPNFGKMYNSVGRLFRIDGDFNF